jgi:hypothetical protein
MDIKDFVENTLLQIVQEVNSANEKLKDTGAIISSKNVRPLREGTTYNSSTYDLVNLIEFDIAVTVNEKDTANGGMGIKIAGISIGGRLQNETANQSINKIKFSIPLTLKSQ